MNTMIETTFNSEQLDFSYFDCQNPEYLIVTFPEQSLNTFPSENIEKVSCNFNDFSLSPFYFVYEYISGMPVVINSNDFCKILYNIISTFLEKNIDNSSINKYITYILPRLINMIDINKVKSLYPDIKFPCLIMEGTQDQWENMYDIFQEINANIFNTELDSWFNKMTIVMNFFIEMRRCSIGGIMKSSEYQANMWEKFFVIIQDEYQTQPTSKISGKMLIGGWVNLFFPYNSDGELFTDIDDIPCLNINTDEKKFTNGSTLYALHDRLKDFYIARDYGLELTLTQ